MTHNALKQQMLEAAEKAPAGSWFYDSYSTILSTVEIVRDEKHNEGTSTLVCGIPAFSGDQAFPPDTYTAAYIEATQPANIRSLIEGYETKLATANMEALERSHKALLDVAWDMSAFAVGNCDVCEIIARRLRAAAAAAEKL